MSPTVCCVMLVDGREEMVKRAIASFDRQRYSNKSLHIQTVRPHDWLRSYSHRYDCIPGLAGKTIGAMRNCANSRVKADLIAHWDSDDWSHSRRLEEQVALLEASGKECVGYRELLFWDTRGSWEIGDGPVRADPFHTAWIYRNHQANWAAGASFLYRRELWQQQPFDDAPHEDQRWWLTPRVSRNCLGVSVILPMEGPRMVCGIHGSNSEAYDRAVMLRNPDVWRRAPEWDSYCERVMKCA